MNDTLPDADEMLDSLAELGRRAERRLGRAPAELYRRSSMTVRVAHHAGQGGDRIQVGVEDGLALRVAVEGRITFAATSGCGEAALDRLLDRIAAGGGAAGAEAWPIDSAGPRIDRDPIRQPTPEALCEWLTEARTRVEQESRTEVREAWIEAAITAESWWAEPGGTASRVRGRGWARLQPAPRELGPIRHPATIAARRWEDLSRGGWVGVLRDRAWPAGPRTSRLPDGVAILCSPEASADLTLALARTLDQEGIAVGPGWMLSDEPHLDDAPSAARFDDARYPTDRRVLADGRTVVGLLQGGGTLRRPAFRDRPEARVSHLVVADTPHRLPRTVVLATTITLHPLGRDAWAVEIDGGVLREGQPAESIERGLVHTSPRQLVQRCLGTYGPSRRHHRGVTCPAVLFDRVRPA